MSRKDGVYATQRKINLAKLSDIMQNCPGISVLDLKRLGFSSHFLSKNYMHFKRNALIQSCGAVSQVIAVLLLVGLCIVMSLVVAAVVMDPGLMPQSPSYIVRP